MYEPEREEERLIWALQGRTQFGRASVEGFRTESPRPSLPTTRCPSPPPLSDRPTGRHPRIQWLIHIHTQCTDSPARCAGPRRGAANTPAPCKWAARDPVARTKITAAKPGKESRADVSVGPSYWSTLPQPRQSSVYNLQMAISTEQKRVTTGVRAQEVQ